MATLDEQIFDALRGVFEEHAAITIDRFDIDPAFSMKELFGNDIEKFALAIAHFLADFQEQKGLTGYITVPKEQLFEAFKTFNDVFVYFCLIFEVEI
ncbi:MULTISPECIES: hypothetical protein [unclassified Bacillus cereus group]|uniref:hypothetical protein n=1 Tax=unclassified Bacillus cereus group TaxID=2750818 RepID=UPI0029C20441|nr:MULTISPECIES: hypothetical protein [unclassified Bacillus cereus group]MDX5880830.1 hypothetical protein [Bacillus cereus group sp. BfR-BA-01042]MDX5906676.1 hypothetical protein [Bacillus cereus group sp. BfR-BA-01048]